MTSRARTGSRAAAVPPRCDRVPARWRAGTDAQPVGRRAPPRRTGDRAGPGDGRRRLPPTRTRRHRPWTRAHLLELSGLGGSGEPPHELSVPEFGRAVADWLTARRLGRLVLAGHSSGTQVAAEAAVGHPDVTGVVLASPTVDPVARDVVRLLV